MEKYRKELLYRSRYRGFKEADIILGRFVEQHIHCFSEEEIKELSELLEVPDHTLYHWITEKIRPVEAPKSRVLDQIRKFNVFEGS